jgi:hypothetical protein
MFASLGPMIDDDLRRGYGVCEETGRGNLSSSKKSPPPQRCLFYFVCGWKNRARSTEKVTDAPYVAKYRAGVKVT